MGQNLLDVACGRGFLSHFSAGGRSPWGAVHWLSISPAPESTPRAGSWPPVYQARLAASLSELTDLAVLDGATAGGLSAAASMLIMNIVPFSLVNEACAPHQL